MKTEALIPQELLSESLDKNSFEDILDKYQLKDLLTEDEKAWLNHYLSLDEQGRSRYYHESFLNPELKFTQNFKTLSDLFDGWDKKPNTDWDQRLKNVQKNAERNSIKNEREIKKDPLPDLVENKTNTLNEEAFVTQEALKLQSSLQEPIEKTEKTIQQARNISQNQRNIDQRAQSNAEQIQQNMAQAQSHGQSQSPSMVEERHYHINPFAGAVNGLKSLFGRNQGHNQNHTQAGIQSNLSGNAPGMHANSMDLNGVNLDRYAADLLKNQGINKFNANTADLDILKRADTHQEVENGETLGYKIQGLNATMDSLMAAASGNRSLLKDYLPILNKAETPQDQYNILQDLFNAKKIDNDALLKNNEVIISGGQQYVQKATDIAKTLIDSGHPEEAEKLMNSVRENIENMANEGFMEGFSNGKYLEDMKKMIDDLVKSIQDLVKKFKFGGHRDAESSSPSPA